MMYLNHIPICISCNLQNVVIELHFIQTYLYKKQRNCIENRMQNKLEILSAKRERKRKQTIDFFLKSVKYLQ